MSKTINCTNPACNELISVLKGEVSVICPSCNTWHFPPAEDEGNNDVSMPPDYSSSGTNDGYGMPPIPGDDAGKIEEPYIPPEEDVFTPPPPQEPTPKHILPEEPNAVGVLVTDTGERLLLKEGKNILGRTGTDLIINDRTVSRRHCVVDVANNGDYMGYTIYDIGHLEGKQSTNGVFISGRSQRLENHERLSLANGTSIRIGNVRLIIQY